MVSEKWNKMTKYQRYGNITSELWRSKHSLEIDNIDNYKLSMYRVLEMLDYNKAVEKNIEMFRFYEYIAQQIDNPDIEILNNCYNYTMGFMK